MNRATIEFVVYMIDGRVTWFSQFSLRIHQRTFLNQRHVQCGEVQNHFFKYIDPAQSIIPANSIVLLVYKILYRRTRLAFICLRPSARASKGILHNIVLHYKKCSGAKRKYCDVLYIYNGVGPKKL